MKKLILCKLIVLQSMCLLANANSKVSLGYKSVEIEGNASFNFEITDFITLLILIMLVFGSFQYYRYYKRHLRINKSIEK